MPPKGVTVVFAFLGTTEIIIILAIALLVFGPAKLPEIGRQIGTAMRELRRMSGDVQRALDFDDYRYDSTPRYGNTSYPYTPVADNNYSTETSLDHAETSVTHDPVHGPWSIESESSDSSDSNTIPHARVYESNGSDGAFIEPPGPPSRRQEQSN